MDGPEKSFDLTVPIFAAIVMAGVFGYQMHWLSATVGEAATWAAGAGLVMTFGTAIVGTEGTMYPAHWAMCIATVFHATAAVAVAAVALTTHPILAIICGLTWTTLLGLTLPIFATSETAEQKLLLPLALVAALIFDIAHGHVPAIVVLAAILVVQFVWTLHRPPVETLKC